MNAPEGNIKFSLEWKDEDPCIPASLMAELNRWRSVLRDLEMIGCTPGGVGYGNLSAREQDQTGFYITGSATGAIQTLDQTHYSRVTEYYIRENRLSCCGRIKASSESLSHAAIYSADPSIRSVFHVHHRALWNFLCNRIPTTSPAHAYGTTAIALEIQEMLRDHRIARQQVIAMGGHEEGIISWGADPDDAGRLLLACYQQL